MLKGTVILLLIHLIQIIPAARILALFPYASPSHLIYYKPILLGLAERGHEITFVAPLPFTEETNVTNIVQHVPEGWMIYIKQHFPNMVDLKMKDQNIVFHMPQFGKPACEFLLKTKLVKDILSSKEKFDIMLTGTIVNECALPFAYKLQVPYITITSAALVPWVDNAVWNPQPWSYVSNLYLPYSDHMDFWERFYNTFFSIALRIYREFFYFRDMDKLIRQHLGDDVPSLSELEKNASLVFVNSDDSIDYPRPNLPNVIRLAATHCRPPKLLPKEVGTFVDESGEAGFIVFSMGSVLAEKDFPPHILSAFVEAFSKIPQRVIWKWNAASPSGVTPNVKLLKWLPQQDILGHPNIRAFITHGGLQSCQEAVYHRVPIIGIPMFADQGWNIVRAKRDGTGVLLELTQITTSTILEALDKVVNDSSYRLNMEERSRIMKDKPVDPVQLAVYWTEYVIRHKGAKHLRSAAFDLNWFQLYLLDVIAVAALLVLATSLILWKVFSYLVKTFTKKDQIKKQKKN